MRFWSSVGSINRVALWKRLVFSLFVLTFVMHETGRRCESAEWSMTPSFGVKGVYNDNLLLTHLPHEATYGYWLSPAAEFAGKTERLSVSGKVAADFVSYYGGQASSFTNVFLPLSLRYGAETNVWEFNGGYIRDNTLMSELNLTGIVIRFTQRDQWNANPSWTRIITERLSLQASFQFSDTRYEDGLRLGLQDYQVLGGALGLLYQFTESDQARLTATYATYYTTNGPFMLRAGFPGVVAGLNHSFTESFTGTVYGGPRLINSTTQSSGELIKTEDIVWTFGAGLTKKFESASVELTAGRDVLPSGFGLLVKTDRVSITSAYALSERVSASLSAAGYITTGATTLARGGNIPQFTHGTVTPKLSWNFLEYWRADLSYTYGILRVETSPLAVGTGNAVNLMVTFTPAKFSFSR